MVVIHGGGWTEGFGDRTDFVSPSFELAKAGYVVFNIAYRLLPDHPWPAQLDDVQRAVRWIRANAATYRSIQADRLLRPFLRRAPGRLSGRARHAGQH